MKRSKPLAPMSAKAKARQEALEGFRAEVLKRAGYRCERCKWPRVSDPAAPVSRVSFEPRLHAHHVISRAQGGSDDPSNGVCLCLPCHDAIHTHTALDWSAWIATKRGTPKRAP